MTTYDIENIKRHLDSGNHRKVKVKVDESERWKAQEFFFRNGFTWAEGQTHVLKYDNIDSYVLQKIRGNYKFKTGRGLNTVSVTLHFCELSELDNIVENTFKEIFEDF